MVLRPHRPQSVLIMVSGDKGIRTLDPLLARQVLSQLSYTQATGKEEHFAGHLFDPVVFDDSVKEFLKLKVKLADYFDEPNL